MVMTKKLDYRRDLRNRQHSGWFSGLWLGIAVHSTTYQNYKRKNKNKVREETRRGGLRHTEFFTPADPSRVHLT